MRREDSVDYGFGEMYRSVSASAATRGGMATDSGDGVVKLDQIPRWTDSDQRSLPNEDPSLPYSYFSDPLTSLPGADGGGDGTKSRFPVDHEINSKIYLWRGHPWNLEVDAVVNSSNEVESNFSISVNLEGKMLYWTRLMCLDWFVEFG